MSHMARNRSSVTDRGVATEARSIGPSSPRGLAAVLRVGFVVTLALFLTGGFILVGAQALELALGNGNAVATLREKVGPPTFITATVCGLFAFAQEYLHPHRGGENG